MIMVKVFAWGMKLDKLVEDLLNIEKAGNDSLAQLEEECAAHAKQAEAEIARVQLEIRLKTERAIDGMRRDAEDSCKAELAMIESEYSQKVAELRELYDSNAAAWREELVGRVLRGI